ncbi:MAG: glycosyltransferase family 2 protein [Candidatus Shapirobacteria bacterium]
MTPNFSLAIPNLNGSQYLQKCLPSLLASISKIKNSKFQIILIDNGSTDDSLDIFQELVQPTENLETKIILHQENTGVAPAFAEGIEKSKYEWTVIVNNDITLKPDWFPLIVKNMAQHPTASVYCGTILNHDGSKFESQGLKFDYRGKCQNISNNITFDRSSIQNLKPKIIWGTSAAIAVYHRDTVLKIGNFDPDFFAYEEDVDLSLRLQKHHFKTLYIPKAISYHLGGATSNKMGNFRQRMDVKNWIWLIAKNYSKKEFCQNFFSLTEERLRNLSGLIKATPIGQLPGTFFSTYYQTFKLLPKMLRKRKTPKTC